MDQTVIVVALAAMASQITTLVRYASAREYRQAVTTMLPWLAAFVALLAGAQADAIADWVLPGLETRLGDLDVASLAFVAVSVGATGGFGYKALTAIDNSDSAAEPPLGGGPEDPPRV